MNHGTKKVKCFYHAVAFVLPKKCILTILVLNCNKKSTKMQIKDATCKKCIQCAKKVLVPSSKKSFGTLPRNKKIVFSL